MGEGDDIVAQLAIGDAAFWVSSGGTDGPRFSPQAIGGATGRTLLMVDDPDAMFGQAVTAGASPAAAMADEHGWRLGRIVDPFGHEWEIGRPLVHGRPETSQSAAHPGASPATAPTLRRRHDRMRLSARQDAAHGRLMA